MSTTKTEIPIWKQRVAKHPENKKWKRDKEGYPIFHDSKKCVRCNKKPGEFSSEWYAFKYQILGYCEDCTNEIMGKLDNDIKESTVPA